MSELLRRNSLCPPHLRSCYAPEVYNTGAVPSMSEAEIRVSAHCWSVLSGSCRACSAASVSVPVLRRVLGQSVPVQTFLPLAFIFLPSTRVWIVFTQ